jgi:hypothetical protein
MTGSVGKDGSKKEIPLVVDVFLRCMAARYRFLTGYLLGRVSLSLQATQQSHFLGSLAAFRMTGLTVAEVTLVAEAVARVLLPREPNGQGVHKSMLGFVFSREACLMLVTGKWETIDWEAFLLHEPEAFKMQVTLAEYYGIRTTASGKERALNFTSVAEMTRLS